MSRMASVPTFLISGRAWRILSRHLLCISTDCVGGTSARTIGCGLYDVHGINMNGRGSGRRLHLTCVFQNSMLSRMWSFEVQRPSDGGTGHRRRLCHSTMLWEPK